VYVPPPGLNVGFAAWGGGGGGGVEPAVMVITAEAEALGLVMDVALTVTVGGLGTLAGAV